MHPIKSIRNQLNLTQAALAEGIGCTQGNIGHYENKGQSVPPDVAKRLIAFAAPLGLQLTYDDIYKDPAPCVDPTESAQGATTFIAKETENAEPAPENVASAA